jgi:hypothetical protein
VRCNERAGELHRRRVALGRVLGERLPKRDFDFLRCGGKNASNRGNRLGESLAEHRLRSGSDKGLAAGEHLVKHAGKAVLIASPVDDGFAGCLLRTDIGRRPYHHARLRQRIACSHADRFGDAEIHHHRFAFLQHHVLGLDVAMDDVLAVSVIERRYLSIAKQAVPQRLAFHHRHHVEEEAAGFA